MSGSHEVAHSLSAALVLGRSFTWWVAAVNMQLKLLRECRYQGDGPKQDNSQCLEYISAKGGNLNHKFFASRLKTRKVRASEVSKFKSL